MDGDTSISSTAKLSISVPCAAALESAPTPTPRRSNAEDSEHQAVDAWLTQHAGGATSRQSVFYDEEIAFHVAVRLPMSCHAMLSRDTEVARERVSALFLGLSSSIRSTTSQPLHVAAELALQDAADHSELGLGTPRRGSSSTKRTLWSGVFDPLESGTAKDKTRAWVGLDVNASEWVACYEFRAPVAFQPNGLVGSKLALTSTVVFDDEALSRLLNAPTPRGTQTPSGAETGMDTYLEESFDYVNLLENLHDPSLHVPFSRLTVDSSSDSRPLPPPPPPPSKISHKKGHSRSLSLKTGADPFVAPSTISKSCYASVDTKSALHVSMRTVPCPVRSFSGCSEGIALAVQVEPASDSSLSLEALTVEPETPARASDIEVKAFPGTLAREYPYRLQPGDRQQLLYAVHFSPESASPDHAQSALETSTSVPLHLLASPAPPRSRYEEATDELPASYKTSRNISVTTTIRSDDDARVSSVWHCQVDIANLVESVRLRQQTIAHPSPRDTDCLSNQSREALERSAAQSSTVAGNQRLTMSNLGQRTPLSPQMTPMHPSRTPQEQHTTPEARDSRRFFTMPSRISTAATQRLSAEDSSPPPPTPAYPPKSSLGLGAPPEQSHEEVPEKVIVSVTCRSLEPGERGSEEAPTAQVLEGESSRDESERHAHFPPGSEKSAADRGSERKWSTPHVRPLEVFLVEVFVLNRSERIRRFSVGVPAPRKTSPMESDSEGTLASAQGGIVPLENDVRIGPLPPDACQSVHLRFLALRAGAHTLPALRLTDTERPTAPTLLERPFSVVVVE